MPHQLTDSNIAALRRALSGAYSLAPDVGLRIVWAPLPGRAICAATRIGGTFWVVLDLDKPSAHRHALAMISETRIRHGAPPIDFRDDDLCRDWLAAFGLPAPRSESPPVPFTLQL